MTCRSSFFSSDKPFIVEVWHHVKSSVPPGRHSKTWVYGYHHTVTRPMCRSLISQPGCKACLQRGLYSSWPFKKTQPCAVCPRLLQMWVSEYSLYCSLSILCYLPPSPSRSLWGHVLGTRIAVWQHLIGVYLACAHARTQCRQPITARI